MNTEMNAAWIQSLRQEFPILERTIRGKPLVYTDNAATLQKPRSVIRAMEDFYVRYNSNVHRGAHLLSQEATDAYEAVRGKVARFMGSDDESQIVFTRGTTEALNLVCSSLGSARIEAGDTVLVTRMEHHANFVPWQMLCKKKGARFEIVELGPDDRLDLGLFEKALKLRPKIVAFTAASNVLGAVNDVPLLSRLAREAGSIVVVDGAQAAAHGMLELSKWPDVDFVAWSGHKIGGPTGVGVLWGRKKLLEAMEPLQYGGDMILRVTDQETKLNVVPLKFEAGTPAIAEVIGLGAAIDFWETWGAQALFSYEETLTRAMLARFADIRDLVIYGPKTSEYRVPVFSFSLGKVHPHDLATYLDAHGIAIRAGHHCAQPLLAPRGIESTARVSLSFYNTVEEVDFVARALIKAREYFQ